MLDNENQIKLSGFIGSLAPLPFFLSHAKHCESNACFCGNGGRVRSANRSFAEIVAGLVESMWATDATKRPSAAEVLRQLRTLVNEEPAAAPPLLGESLPALAEEVHNRAAGPREGHPAGV